MEEAWELAAVSKGHDDFSDRLVSAHSKYFLSGCTTIFVCVATVDSSSRVFGFSIGELDERLIEFGFLLVTLFLALNYFLRLLDERRVFEVASEKLKSAEQSIEGSLQKIESLFDSWKKALRPFLNKQIPDFTIDGKNGIDQVIVLKAMDATDPPNKDELSGQEKYEAFAALKVRQWKEIYHRLNGFFGSPEYLKLDVEQEQVLQAAVRDIENAMRALEIYDPKLFVNRRHAFWARTRVWVIDIMAPIVLLAAVLLSYLFTSELVTQLSNILAR